MGRIPRAEGPRRAGGPSRDVGIGLIVVYKAAKALVELALVAGLVALAAGGERGAVGALAEGVRAHLASRWSVAASRALHALTSQRGIHLLEGGLFLDALLTTFEGWSLWKGYRWAPWLVVCATLLPLPWEFWEIARRGSWVRVAIATANLSVAGYLAWRITRSYQRRAGRHPAGPDG